MRNKNNKEKKIKISPNKIEKMYLSGMTIPEISKKYGISVTPIRRIMKEHKILRRKAAPRKGLFSGKGNPAWRGGKRKRSDGYIIVWTPTGDRLEHRLIMERHIKRPLLKTEVVHHKDGNPLNNEICNLEIFQSQKEHAESHGRVNRETLLANGMKECTLCKFIKPVSDFYKTKFNKMGIQSWCKKCKNKRDAQSYRKK